VIQPNEYDSHHRLHLHVCHTSKLVPLRGRRRAGDKGKGKVIGPKPYLAIYAVWLGAKGVETRVTVGQVVMPLEQANLFLCAAVAKSTAQSDST